MGKHTAYPSVVTSTGLFVVIDKDGNVRPFASVESVPAVLRLVDWANRTYPQSAPHTIKAV